MHVKRPQPARTSARPAADAEAEAQRRDPRRGRGHGRRVLHRRAHRRVAVGRRRHRGLRRARRRLLPRARHDVAAAGDGRRHRSDGARRLHASASPTTSHDEIGTLARAFNQMAAELAETDRVRRDLVANVSHELRTPITALQAVLENLVDGVEPPDPETLQHDARPGRTARPARAAAARPVPARVGRRAARPARVRRRPDARARGARDAAARRIGPPLGVECSPSTCALDGRRRAPAPGRRQPRRERGAALAARRRR